MSDYYVLLFYLALLVIGAFEPFALTLGYVWVDTFYPQLLSRLLAGFPVAMVMGGAAIGAYLVFDRRDPPKLTTTAVLTAAMGLWITLTCTWAVAPEDIVWNKWSWAFKTVMFSGFIPYVIRSRVQIEAFLQVFVFSLLVHVVPVGVKTLITGGGYKSVMTIVRANVGVLETSTLATVAIILLPLLLSLRRHSLLLPWPKLRNAIYSVYAVSCVLAALGSYARTALIGFGVLGLTTWLQSRRKVAYAIAIASLVVGAAVLTSDRWRDRMGTIATYSEDASAEARIRVWKWTLDFVSEYPLGGGFNSYYLNSNIFQSAANASGPKENLSKAFHSAYFEMLGEHGWIGLAIFLTLIFTSVRNLLWVVSRSRGIQDLEWCRDIAAACLTALFILMGCAAFIGIGFQVMFWYLFAISACLRQYLLRIPISVIGRPRELTGLGLPPSRQVPGLAREQTRN